MESSLTRDQTRVPYIGRRILIHCTREAQCRHFFWTGFLREEFSNFLWGEHESGGQFSSRWVSLREVNIQFVDFYFVSLFPVRLTPLFSWVWCSWIHRFPGSTSPQSASFPLLCWEGCNLLALWLGELHFNRSLYKLPNKFPVFSSTLQPSLLVSASFLVVFYVENRLTSWLSALLA